MTSEQVEKLLGPPETNAFGRMQSTDLPPALISEGAIRESAQVELSEQRWREGSVVFSVGYSSGKVAWKSKSDQ